MLLTEIMRVVTNTTLLVEKGRLRNCVLNCSAGSNDIKCAPPTALPLRNDNDRSELNNLKLNFNHVERYRVEKR